MSGRKALCVGARHSLCRGPALSVSGPGAALCLARALSGGLCVGARRSLCQGPARVVSGPSALCRGLCRGPPILINAVCVGLALCVGARRFPAVSRMSGPSGLRWSLCRGPALFVSGTGALYVGARRSLCWASTPILLNALCVGLRRSLRRSSALSGAVCVGPAVLSQSFCVGPRRLCVGLGRSLCRAPALFVSGPSALCVALCVGPGALCVGPRRCL